MKLWHRLVYFVGIIVSLLMFMVFGPWAIVVLLIAWWYYWLFIHPIHDTEHKNDIASISIIVVLVLLLW